MKSVLAAKWNILLVFHPFTSQYLLHLHSPLLKELSKNIVQFTFSEENMSLAFRQKVPVFMLSSGGNKTMLVCCIGKVPLQPQFKFIHANSSLSSPTHNRMCYIFSFHLLYPLRHLWESDVYLMSANIEIKSLPSIISLRTTPVFWFTMYTMHAYLQIDSRSTCSLIDFEQKI